MLRGGEREGGGRGLQCPITIRPGTRPPIVRLHPLPITDGGGVRAGTTSALHVAALGPVVSSRFKAQGVCCGVFRRSSGSSTLLHGVVCFPSGVGAEPGAE